MGLAGGRSRADYWCRSAGQLRHSTSVETTRLMRREVPLRLIAGNGRASAPFLAGERVGWGGAEAVVDTMLVGSWLGIAPHQDEG